MQFLSKYAISDMQFYKLWIIYVPLTIAELKRLINETCSQPVVRVIPSRIQIMQHGIRMSGVQGVHKSMSKSNAGKS